MLPNLRDTASCCPCAPMICDSTDDQAVIEESRMRITQELALGSSNPNDDHKPWGGFFTLGDRGKKAATDLNKTEDNA